MLGIHHTTVAYSLSNVALYQILQNSHSRNEDLLSNHILWAAAGCVYSQVSRLSLSMCDPERTVSMSIRRSELRPSGMLGISSSPSDIGSTGIDSCKVIEEVSPESPEEVKKVDQMTQLCGRFKYQHSAGRNLGIWISILHKIRDSCKQLHLDQCV